jgi:hypothetical protein
MGRDLGYFASDELDRPDLNKCPDCGCYFAQTHCPLCDKLCPEEMRAGNRAAPKRQKRRSNSSGRVQFIPWYHSWWFILIMMYLMPVVGIILFFTSPYSKKAKIIAAAIVVAVYVVGFALASGIVMDLLQGSPVNDDISRAEYVELCDSVSVEEFHRDVYNEGRYVQMKLTVVARVTGEEVGDIYYRCRSAEGGELLVLLRDCHVEGRVHYLPGDTILVWGESAGLKPGYTSEGDFSELPCLNMAYSEIVPRA